MLNFIKKKLSVIKDSRSRLDPFRQRPRNRWSVRERRTTNFAVVEFYGSDWLAHIDTTGTKSGGLKDILLLNAS
jgi:hypothetical protein